MNTDRDQQKSLLTGAAVNPRDEVVNLKKIRAGKVVKRSPIMRAKHLGKYLMVFVALLHVANGAAEDLTIDLLPEDTETLIASGNLRAHIDSAEKIKEPTELTNAQKAFRSKHRGSCVTFKSKWDNQKKLYFYEEKEIGHGSYMNRIRLGYEINRNGKKRPTPVALKFTSRRWAKPGRGEDGSFLKVEVDNHPKYFETESILMELKSVPTIQRIRDGSPTCLQYGKGNNEWYKYSVIVSEYFPYGNLLDVINGKLLTEDIARRQLKPIFVAVENLHEKNIAHRDIKPQNIMVNEAGELVLIDFGCAKKCPENEHFQAHEKFGTKHYLPLDYHRSDGCTKKVDVFALGVTLYFAIVGDYPFKDTSYSRYDSTKKKEEDLINKAFESERARKLVSRHLQDLLRKMWRLEQDRIGIQEALEHDWFKETAETEKPLELLLQSNFVNDLLMRKLKGCKQKEDQLRIHPVIQRQKETLYMIRLYQLNEEYGKNGTKVKMEEWRCNKHTGYGGTPKRKKFADFIGSWCKDCQKEFKKYKQEIDPLFEYKGNKWRRIK